ncbi:MAG: ribosome biogenesis protein [Nanoarchaeota archaeon]|nr:ribosome biogenesis protein [Nanoarchaeota archaeon]
MNKIKYCPKCKEYTLEEVCPRCGEKTVSRIPPRYSPKEEVAKYRRKLRRDILKKEGLL